MVEELGPVRLKNGAEASFAIVHGPDAAWADRLEPMLAHKGEPWTWQNRTLLREPTGLDARFHVLHRAGRPFAHLMVVGHGGVGLLGHVWTDPAERGAGASSVLMELALARFRTEGGLALALGSEPDSAAFHYYRRRGFEPVAPGSGYMLLCPGGEAAFRSVWFKGDARVAPLDWPDWPAAAPLCLGDFPGRIRLAATGLVGRLSSEGAFLPVLRRQAERRAAGAPDCAVVLRSDRGAVLGFATRLPDPLWPDRDLLDLYCHPPAWNRAGELLAALAPNPGRAAAAYVDDPAKASALAAAGWRRTARLPDWLEAGGSVEVWEEPQT